jgi:hypothetical protein
MSASTATTERLCHCGCGASLDGFSSQRKWRYSSCRPQREPNNEHEIPMLRILRNDPCAYCGITRRYPRTSVTGMLAVTVGRWSANAHIDHPRRKQP